MKLDPQKTALLSLDMQNAIVSAIKGSEAAFPAAAKALAFARSNGFKVIHVGLGYSEGHPEVLASHPRWGRVKQMGGMIAGSPAAQTHSSIFQTGDTVVYKHRMGAFGENQLDLILRSQAIENLVLFGVSSSGIVLSTLRRAYDMDYNCLVLSDACFDPDPEVHRVLCEKVFTMQAAVFDADGFIAAQSA